MRTLCVSRRRHGNPRRPDCDDEIKLSQREHVSATGYQCMPSAHNKETLKSSSTRACHVEIINDSLGALESIAKLIHFCDI